MARQARVVAPGYPHHVIQRGNRRQPTFFEPTDYKLYLDLLAEECMKADVDIWAYCLMPNHVHLVVVPAEEDGLSQAVGYTHRRYTRIINKRMEWSGYLWQGRFASSAMDESYLLAVARYVELNPVKAGIVPSPGDYRWSSARHHLGIRNDPLLENSPLPEMVDGWQAFLVQDNDENLDRKIKQAGNSGNPIGSDDFVSRLECEQGRALTPQKPGPKRYKRSVQFGDT